MSDFHDESNNKSRGRLTPSSEVLQTLLQKSKSPLSQGFTRWKVWSQWREIVGPNIASHSQPLGYLKGTLYVWVDSSSRMQEMIFLVSSFRDKINQHLGKKWVHSLRFTLNAGSVPEKALSEEAFQFLEGSPR